MLLYPLKGTGEGQRHKHPLQSDELITGFNLSPGDTQIGYSSGVWTSPDNTPL